MRTRTPKPRDCRVIEAYPAGPSEFYARPVLPMPARPPEERSYPPPPAALRPRNFVRSFPRVATPAALAAQTRRGPRFHAAAQVPSAAPAAPSTEAAVPWSLDPLAVALLVTFLPPVGVTLLWASPRFTVVAKAVVTAFVGALLLLAWAMIPT